ncbi:hypothetical protein BGW39_009762 [Mortierella sp. 14UC]|nr:hypothetical protein BGW39_009762 [Mortierella sp. 14UC]
MSTSIEDNELPRAILTRIMKQALPENTNIQANAKLAMTKSTTLFINYLTSAANEVAANAGHKIVSGAHVLKALEAVDLEEMLPRLTAELQAFQSIQRSRKQVAAKASKDKDASLTAAESKKRKPASDESGSAAKSRKSSISANPRDGQDTPSDMQSDDEDKEDDDEEDDEAEEDEEEEEAGEGDDPEKTSLNMNDPEQEEKQLDQEEDDDSDGF